MVTPMHLPRYLRKNLPRDRNLTGDPRAGELRGLVCLVLVTLPGSPGLAAGNAP